MRERGVRKQTEKRVDVTTTTIGNARAQGREERNGKKRGGMNTRSRTDRYTRKKKGGEREREGQNT